MDRKLGPTGRCALGLCVMTLASGCTNDIRADQAAGEAESTPATTGAPSPETPDPTTSSTGPTTTADPTTSSTSSDATDPTGSLVLDVAAADMGAPSDGCQGVDLLFVIDDSGSMGAYQANLGNSVPGFVEALRDALPTDDYHVMVVDSTGVPAGPCSVRLGAGNRGNGAGSECIPDSQPNYLIGDEQINTLFPCLAHTGTSGASAEQVTDAMLNALSPGFVGPDGCNEGFLRDDSILFVVVITDEFAGWAGAGWANILSAYKPPESIVVLTLIGDNPADGDPYIYPASADMTPWGTMPTCDPWGYFDGDNQASPQPGLVEFAQTFDDRGFMESICADDYSDVLLSAVDTLAITCEEFTPAG